ncbi:unnamed protein product, partial [Mesorhabditis spiculigera]
MNSFVLIALTLVALTALCAARPHQEYDYATDLAESTEDPGVAIDREVTTSRHHYTHHHHKKHHHDGESTKDYLKTNRLGKLRKYFEDHYL